MQTLELTGTVRITDGQLTIDGQDVTARISAAFPGLRPLTAIVATGGDPTLYVRGAATGISPCPQPGDTPDFGPAMWLGDTSEIPRRLGQLNGQVVHLRIDNG